jgi:phosphate transport system protein
MKYYEERLENDLAAMRSAVKEMGDRVQEAVKDAVHALLTGNRQLSNETILNDGYINRDMRRINHLCHNFIARHLPSAGHLRRISSVLLTNISLERIGDYAVTICREQKQLSEPPKGALARDIELLANDSRAMLRQAINAFEQENADLAKGTVVMAEQIENTFSHIFPDLLALGQQNGYDLKQIFAVLSALNYLERISDQAKNICEEAVFLVTGEAKPFKIYNILFLDERNDSLSQMAEAIARKAFPGSGIYTSRGRHPTHTLHAGMVDFMNRHGYDFTDVHPRSLDLSPQELKDFHVIASLGEPVTRYIGNLPFHTVDLQWEFPVPPAEGQSDDQDWEQIYRHLLHNIHQLMEALRGEEAP